MKRLSTIVLSLILALGLTQCKKNEPATTDSQDETMTINLSVKGNRDAKAVVNPVTGSVDYETGDQIIVANGGKYVGTLTYNGTLFTGAIGNATEGLPLQFYFLGNVAPEETLSIGNTESCSVVISDQTEHLPVISTAPSNENFYGNVTDYTAELLNQCALVKFNVTTSSEAAICLAGFNNKVTVDFGENTLTNSQEGDGIITLPAGNGEKWAILLPQEAMDGGNANSEDGGYTGTYGNVPAIFANGYFPAGIAVDVTTGANVAPVGAINALFSVSATQQVYFSQGNLQYIGSAATPYWKFADNQWDYLGTTTGQNSSSQTVDRDLFAWATSGYNHGASSYQPWATSTSTNQYYAYGNSSYSLYDQTGMAEWGYNAIANGGNQENIGWRTLTNNEYDYLFFTRTDAASKYGHGKVNGVNGMILLPDAWTLPDGLTFTSGNSSYANVYNSEQWSQMEANGAVFLPAAGHRRGTTLYNVGNNGYYWGSARRDTAYSYSIDYYSGSIYPQGLGYYPRYYCISVRLVRNAE